MTTTTAADHLTEAKERLAEMKAALAFDLTADPGAFDAERLAKAANAIAAQEGVIRARDLLASLEARNVSAEETQQAMLSEALRGPDDQWSGRANDVRRAYADGHREALNAAMWDLF